MTRRPLPIPLVLLLFTFSGASALVYEIVWSRRLTFVFGAMSHAVATVLAAYMGGLALGSYLLGRRMARGGDPLRIYGILEAGIGLWALVLPALLGALEAAYRVAYRQLDFGPTAFVALRLVLSFAVLIVPTTLMGGTLPVLSALASPARASRWTGLLYSLNTLGAVAGAAGAGFVLLPALGMRATVFLAVLVNALVAAAALWAARARRTAASPMVSVEKPKGAPASGTPQRVVRTRAPSQRAAAMFAYALSGAAALSYEVLWTRVLAGSLGTTTYAFTTMLATFLLGLGIGSYWASRRAPWWPDPVRALGLIQLGAGLSALLSTPLLDRLPAAFLTLAQTWGLSFGSLTLVRFCLASLTMLPTTLFLGAVFPAVVRLGGVDEEARERTSRAVGMLYAANTVGAIAGSVLTAFVLAPAFGRQNTLAGAAFLNAAVGASLLIGLRPPGRTARTNRLLGLAGAAAALLLVLPARSPWNLRAMNAGSYVYARTMGGPEGIERLLDQTEMIFIREDAEATVSVWRSMQRGRKVVSLRINGKVDASTGGDMITQELSGHLPMLLHPAPRRALVIGVASGITLGAVARYPLETIDCAEISPAVVEASGYFGEQNHDALSAPSVRLHVTDGRNFLLLTDESYDVITSEPSNPWVAGITNLFTREFFLLARSRLEPGGLFCQWINLYDLSPDDLRMVLRTFHDVFPTSSAWLLGTSDLLMLGGDEAVTLDLGRIRERVSRREVAEDLAGVGVRGPWSLLSLYVADGDGLGEAAGEGKRVTDDNLALEFSAPRSQGSASAYKELLRFTIATRRSPWPHLRGWDAMGVSAVEARALTDRIFQTRQTGLDLLASGTEDASLRSARLREAFQRFPDDPMVNQLLAETEAVLALDASQEASEVLASAAPSQNLDPAREASLDRLLERGIEHFRWALRADPANPGLHHSIGVDLGRLGNHDNAVAELEEAVGLDPTYFAARADLGVAYANLDRKAEAAAQWNAALKLQPGDPRVTRLLEQLRPSLP
jgi:spermidine synthase